MSKRRMPKLKPGTRIEITWWDIVSSPIGDVDDAEPALCTTLGYFHCYKGRGIARSLVAGLTLFPKEGGDPRGTDVYPVGCIEKIEILSTEKERYQRPPSAAIIPAEGDQ
jgi:hypothetical protein